MPKASVYRLKFSVDIHPLQGCSVKWERGWGFDVTVKTARKHQVGMNRISRLLKREAWKESAGAVLYEVETGTRILMYGTRYHEDVPMIIIGQGSRFKNQGLLYTPLAMCILIGGDEWEKYNALVFPKLEEVIRVYNGQKIQGSPTTQEVGHNQGAGGSGESEVSDVLESGEDD